MYIKIAIATLDKRIYVYAIYIILGRNACVVACVCIMFRTFHYRYALYGAESDAERWQIHILPKTQKKCFSLILSNALLSFRFVIFFILFS